MLSWLKKPAFIHIGDKTHKVMQFLQDAWTPVSSTSGTWRLWYPAQEVPLAISICQPNVPTKVKEEDNASSTSQGTQAQAPEGTSRSTGGVGRKMTHQEKMNSSLEEIIEEGKEGCKEHSTAEGANASGAASSGQTGGSTSAFGTFHPPTSKAKAKGSDGKSEGSSLKRDSAVAELLRPLAPDSIRKEAKRQKDDTPDLMQY